MNPNNSTEIPVPTEFTQGICSDGIAILKDGLPMTSEEILSALNKSERRRQPDSNQSESLLTRWEKAYSGYAILSIHMADRWNYVSEPSRENIGKLITETRDLLRRRTKVDLKQTETITKNNSNQKPALGSKTCSLDSLIVNMEGQATLSEGKAGWVESRKNKPEISFHTLHMERASIWKFCADCLKEISKTI